MPDALIESSMQQMLSSCSSGMNQLGNLWSWDMRMVWQKFGKPGMADVWLNVSSVLLPRCAPASHVHCISAEATMCEG
eukprot:361475-Chlamydomonas_euryale.AAC.2